MYDGIFCISFHIYEWRVVLEKCAGGMSAEYDRNYGQIVMYLHWGVLHVETQEVIVPKKNSI